MNNNPKGKGGFTKGDPRINRNGRPKSFDALRKLAQQLSSEVAKDRDGNELIRDGHKVTIAEMVLFQMLSDKKQRKEFLEIAFGKVPQNVDFTTKGDKIESVNDERLDRSISTLADALGEIISGKSTERSGEVGTAE